MSFETKQGYLVMDSPAITRKVAIGTHHAMARHNDADGIPTNRTPYCLSRHFRNALFLCDLIGYLTIGHGFSEWDFSHDVRDLLTKRGEILNAIIGREIGLMASEIAV